MLIFLPAGFPRGRIFEPEKAAIGLLGTAKGGVFVDGRSDGGGGAAPSLVGGGGGGVGGRNNDSGKSEVEEPLGSFDRLDSSYFLGTWWS